LLCFDGSLIKYARKEKGIKKYEKKIESGLMSWLRRLDRLHIENGVKKREQLYELKNSNTAH
jgi:hypothetical protein